MGRIAVIQRAHYVKEMLSSRGMRDSELSRTGRWHVCVRSGREGSPATGPLPPGEFSVYRREPLESTTRFGTRAQIPPMGWILRHLNPGPAGYHT